jgi:hypothetical protein
LTVAQEGVVVFEVVDSIPISHPRHKQRKNRDLR